MKYNIRPFAGISASNHVPQKTAITSLILTLKP